MKRARVAVLSDIHGNLWALEAVLRDLAGQGVDLVVDAGDLLSGPLEPAATCDLLQSLAWPTVAGNQERQLLACEQRPGGRSDQYAFEHTTTTHRAWLRSLPATLALDDPGLFVCHGTPASDCTYLLEDVSSGVAHPRERQALEAAVAGLTQRLVVCGHSHVPGQKRLADGRLVVNAGSVGLPAYDDDDDPCPHVMETGSPAACYAICELGPEGWTASHRHVPYDHHRAVEKALAADRQDWARWLETGRATAPSPCA